MTILLLFTVILYSRVGVFARTDSRGEVMNNFIHFCGDGITLTNRPLRSTRNTTSKQNRIQAKKQEQRCSDVFTAVKVSASEPVKEVFANQENKKNNTNVENNSDNVKARFVEVTIDNPNFIVMNNILTKCNEHTVRYSFNICHCILLPV
jgi:NADH:ubiquinone oxidoreductase subunit D